MMDEKLTACKDCDLYLGRDPDTNEDTCSHFESEFKVFDYWNGEYNGIFKSQLCKHFNTNGHCKWFKKKEDGE